MIKEVKAVRRPPFLVPKIACVMELAYILRPERRFYGFKSRHRHQPIAGVGYRLAA